MKTLVLLCTFGLISLYLSAQTVDVNGSIASTTTHTCSGKKEIVKSGGGKTFICLKNNKTKEEKLMTQSDSLGSFHFTIDTTDSKHKDLHFIDVLIGIDTIISIQEIKQPFWDLYLTKEIKDPVIRVRGRKPVIYIYPLKEETVSLKLDLHGTLGTTFPKYNNEWTVTAKPNGELTNLADKRKYNYLFWEGECIFPPAHRQYANGFVVAMADLNQFLINKLTYLGLSNTEINDFCVYWLPQLEKNEYNLIHFFVNDNIDNCCFLQVNPKPDTEIRVFMEFKSVDKNLKIAEQPLPHLTRKGYTIIEWGGGIYGSNKLE